ncbi:hypothetical protein ACUY4R_000821 [Kosakonia sp. BK9b]|uniref:hypothetical protein n=1 Tax=Kosakonia sp. TaxID=1916651 RepID=UPI00289D324A|nr:hypothetical protein [Kosakonia sp.]
MVLPPYSSSVRWHDFRIDTPTFELTPVEKPDMSPFLFHMTGRKAIESILSPEDNFLYCEGFLRASIPEAQSEDRHYQAKVVCFSESPTFALDFFRYRSYRRWSSDQLYGIGFDKSALAKLGARPCIYADEKLKKDILFIKQKLDKADITDDELAQRLTSLVSGTYPLMMPLLEDTAKQGFMWEREWRYANEEMGGLVFPYSAIRVICCPEDEVINIKRILGQSAETIAFIHSWREYDEVTTYLRNRKKEMHIPQSWHHSNEKEFLESLVEQLNNHEKVLNKISAFKGFIDTIESKESATNAALQELQESIQTMQAQVDKLRERLK